MKIETGVIFLGHRLKNIARKKILSGMGGQIYEKIIPFGISFPHSRICTNK